MQRLWRTLWPDVALAVAALLSLQLRATSSSARGWPDAPLWIRLVLMAVPLAIAIRRIEPALALPVLIAGAYFAGLVGQPDWFLLGGAVLALWSLAGRCRVPVVLVVAGFSAALPLLLNQVRARLMDFLYAPADNGYKYLSIHGWQRWQAILVIVVALLFLTIRRRSWAQAVTATTRLRDLRTFLRDPSYSRQRDVLLAVAASGLVLAEIGEDLIEGNWWSAPRWMPYAVAYACLTLVLRRVPVVPVVVLAAASLIANWQASTPILTLYGAFGLALYRLVVVPTGNRSLRWTVPTAVGVLIAMPLITWRMRYVVMVLIFPKIKQGGLEQRADGILHNLDYEAIVRHQWPISFALTLLLPVCAGVAVRLYRRNVQAAEREAELERTATEREAARVVLTERSYIARDLHDVVAHAVNLMVIQAETGPDLVRRGDDDVLAGFQRIGDAGRRALSELDRLLSALRDADGVPDPQLAPQPGLADLPQLVADVSDDHLPIELDLRGDPDGPPEGQQLAAYRLVQEALTNVVRHAKASAARVLVQVEETGVRVEVSDDGSGFDVEAAARGTRHGLAGMRERARIEGGTLDVRSTPGSGTTVTAWFPVGGGR
ncbi:sensor histidine kinase [Kribbella sp. NPDC059898]|uniref:sensor histidine kinase n=1 Tax=Kribbella sp. NPDC059898 TaxID=3346995 RepID=UPI0036615D64